MRILIIDDEKNIRASLSRFFDLNGHQTIQLKMAGKVWKRSEEIPLIASSGSEIAGC